MVGSIPFIGLGFALAYLLSPSAAPAVANLLFIVLAFGSGMLVQVEQMPEVMRTIAPFLPTYHYAQLAWGAIGAGSETLVISGAWLAGYALLFMGVAAWAYRREAARKFA
jgi:ABC-2 type transport system permease protein